MSPRFHFFGRNSAETPERSGLSDMAGQGQQPTDNMSTENVTGVPSPVAATRPEQGNDTRQVPPPTERLSFRMADELSIKAVIDVARQRRQQRRPPKKTKPD
jgi:hypothetical protein